MRNAKSIGLLAALLLIAAGVVQLTAWAEITFETGEAGQAEWWFVGDHAICDSDGSAPYCETPYGNHWSAELGTHTAGDWAYVALDTGSRMTLAQLTALRFRHMEVDLLQVDAPSMALALEGGYLAISRRDGPSPTCTNYAPTGSQRWWFGTWIDEDPSTLVLDSYTPLSSSPRTLADLQSHAPIMNLKVLKVMVLANVVGDYVGSPGGALPIAASTSVVDRVQVEWTDSIFGPGTGGYYNLEPEWPFDVLAGQDVGDGIYDFDDGELGPQNPPLQFEHWCADSVFCPHCQPLDDDNLWKIVYTADFTPSIPEDVIPFASPDYAIYFGNPEAGTYKSGERAVGAICSPYNEVNPADRYISIDFDQFREVEFYESGEYDWTYVQIQFVDNLGNPAWPACDSGLPGWFDPFDYDPNSYFKSATCQGPVTPSTHYINGDIEPHYAVYNRGGAGCIDPSLYNMACYPLSADPSYAAALKNTGWKTVWYKDSTDVSSSIWEHVEITHYLDPDHEPYTDDAHRLMIPPGATRMRIRFVFNSVDGAANDHFGWVVDNIEKHHSYDKPGCKICTDGLPQGGVDEKYGTVQSDSYTYFALCPMGDGQRIYWELDSVVWPDGRERDELPGRLALDPVGKIYGKPDVDTIGTYLVTLTLHCGDGSRPDQKTFSLIIRPSQTIPQAAQIGVIEHFGAPQQPLPTTWINAGTGKVLPATGTLDCDDENLWHQTSMVKYALDTPTVQGDLGVVAYFGMEDNGTPAQAHDPNYGVNCGRKKGCMYNPYPFNNTGEWVVTDDSHVGQELVIGFKSWRDVEYYAGGEYDKTWVTVAINSGAAKTVWSRSSIDVSDPKWRWEEADTGIILKKGDKIVVSFCFDSVDAYNNGKKGEAWGWLVDEVTLMAGSSSLSIMDCPRQETTVGEYYREEIRVTGGPALTDIDWSVSGTLPPGLGLDLHPSDTRIAYITGMAREAGTFNFTLKAKIRGGQMMAQLSCCIIVGREVTLLWEDFEQDPEWSGTGLWRYTGTDQAPNPDPVTQVPTINDEIQSGNLGDANHAAYYGRLTVADYNTGATTSGMLTLTLPIIDLVSGPAGPVDAFRVTLDQYRHVESFAGGDNFDRTYVQVQFDGGAWQTIWERSAADPSVKEWTTEQEGPYLVPSGASTMLIRFGFDSGDKWYNNYTGWLVDNIRVESTSTSAAIAIPKAMATNSPAGRDTPAELQVMNIPNPITDVHTTTFTVRSSDVEALRIVIYDLAGNRVYEEEVFGNELVWHTDNDYGEYLANGIYLYRAYVLMNGVWVETTVEKLVILR